MSTTLTPSGSLRAHLAVIALYGYQWRFAKLVQVPQTDVEGQPVNPPGSDTATLGREAQIDVAADGDTVYGIIVEPAKYAGRTTTVQLFGGSKVQVTYNASAGDYLKPGADGKGVKALPGDHYAAIVIEPGPQGAIVPVTLESGIVPGVPAGAGDGGNVINAM